MRFRSLRTFAIALALAALAGCATGERQPPSEQLARYRTHAGSPVESFHYFGDLHAWTPLGDSAVAVWTRPHEAYLVEIAGPCPDLAFASAIGLTNQSGRVYARFDKVIPARLHGGPPQIPCQIASIRPLDIKGLRAARRAAGASE